MRGFLFFVLLFLIGSVNAQIITTVAGSSSSPGFSGDGGQATNALFDEASGVAFDAAGNMYIADEDNNRIRKVSTSGIINTVAGIGTLGYSGDGGQAILAELGMPPGLTSDSAGNLYIADEWNNRVRKVSLSGTITTVAGTWTSGFSGDGGPAIAAELLHPTGVFLDRKGNLYIADLSNGRIRKVDTAGIITTFAGNGTASFSGDGGPATQAGLKNPHNGVMDQIGNMYIADVQDNRIRKVDTNGIITTVAGNGTATYSGDGGPAISAGIKSPHGVAVDGMGNLYIAEYGSNRIRKVNTSGLISTIAGTGIGNFSGDGGLAIAAEIYQPSSVVVGPGGDLFISDEANNRIRKIYLPIGIDTESQADFGIKMVPNPSSGWITIMAPVYIGRVVITNMIGQTVFEKVISGNSLEIDASKFQSGVYIVRVNDQNRKLIIEK